MASNRIPHWTDARLARWLLPLGLVAGVLAPSWGIFLRPHIPMLIGCLLFIACLRINPIASELHRTLFPSSAWVIFFQLALPTAAGLTLAAFDVPLLWRVPILFALAAAPVTGAPNMVSMLGGKPHVALTSLLIGTALLPLTALPMLWTLPSLHTESAILTTVGRLFFTILAALIAALLVRRYSSFEPEQPNSVAALDLSAALLLAIVVVGLMSGLHAPSVTWQSALIMLLFACLINVSMHALGVCYASFTQRYLGAASLAKDSAGIVSGNRNIALLLTALPMSVLEPHLLFLACYQVPMYLTPIVAAYVWRR